MKRGATDPRVLEARREANSAALLEIDAPMSDLSLFADLSMSWWLNLVEKKGGELRDNGGIGLTKRETAIASYAFGEIWERVQAIDAIVCSPYEGEAAGD